MKNRIVIAMAAVTSLFLSLLIFKDIVAPIFSLFVWIFAIGFMIISFALVGFVCWLCLEHMLTKRAQRRQEETKADVHAVTSPTGEVYIREMNHKAVWRAGHLQQSVYANGRYVPPTQEEREAYILRNSPSTKVIEGQLKQLESGQEQIHFNNLLKDYPHMMLLGATNSGKTTQIVSAIEYRLKQYPNAALVWLSTHAKMDNVKIPSKAVVFNHAEDIASVLQDLFATYTKRREGGSYKQIIIAIDEWPEIVDELKDLGVSGGDILRRLSRGGRKTGFSLILASHGATVSDLDTQGHSSVKQDFAQVYLDKSLTRNGRAIWQQFDKKSSRIEIALPEIVTPELTDREQSIMELYRQGTEPYEIAKQVYSGKPGGNQLNKVRETIIKHT